MNAAIYLPIFGMIVGLYMNVHFRNPTWVLVGRALFVVSLIFLAIGLGSFGARHRAR